MSSRWDAYDGLCYEDHYGLVDIDLNLRLDAETLTHEDHDAELAADDEYLALCDKHTEDAFDDQDLADDRGDFFNPGLIQLGGRR